MESCQIAGDAFEFGSQHEILLLQCLGTLLDGDSSIFQGGIAQFRIELRLIVDVITYFRVGNEAESQIFIHHIMV